jgi:hypothetical protein
MNNVISSFFFVKSFADEFDRATRRARYYQRTSNGECSALDAIPGHRSAVRMGLQSTDAVAPESSIFTGIFVNIASLSLLTSNILRPNK